VQVTQQRPQRRHHRLRRPRPAAPAPGRHEPGDLRRGQLSDLSRPPVQEPAGLAHIPLDTARRQPSLASQVSAVTLRHHLRRRHRTQPAGQRHHAPATQVTQQRGQPPHRQERRVTRTAAGRRELRSLSPPRSAPPAPGPARPSTGSGEPSHTGDSPPSTANTPAGPSDPQRNPPRTAPAAPPPAPASAYDP
jgi:hypothetical protein